MIEVAPETACMIYLALTVIALLVVWFFHRRKSQDVISFTSQRIVCEFCYTPYVDDIKKGLTRCPHCQFLNKHLHND